MIRHLQVKEFVGDNEILKGFALLIEINSERDRAHHGARPPLARHPLHSNNARHHPQLNCPEI
jgi:hypothetical protein